MKVSEALCAMTRGEVPGVVAVKKVGVQLLESGALEESPPRSQSETFLDLTELAGTPQQVARPRSREPVTVPYAE